MYTKNHMCKHINFASYVGQFFPIVYAQKM